MFAKKPAKKVFFELDPRNDYANSVIRSNTKTDFYDGTRVVGFYIGWQHQPKGKPFLSIGTGVNNDIRLLEYYYDQQRRDRKTPGYKGDQCAFHINSASGELVLEDLSSGKTTRLFQHHGNRSFEELRFPPEKPRKRWLDPQVDHVLVLHTDHSSTHIALPPHQCTTCPQFRIKFETVDLNANMDFVKAHGQVTQPRRLGEDHDDIVYKIRNEFLGQSYCNEVFSVVDVYSGAKLALKRALEDKEAKEVKGVKEIKATKEVKAIKAIKGDVKAMIDNEVMILKQIEHNNIVKFIHTQSDPEHGRLIFMEEYDGDLRGNIKGLGPENFPREQLCRDGWTGLAYLNEKGIIHRDIQPGNILYRYLDRKKTQIQFRISDFGLSKWLKNTGHPNRIQIPTSPEVSELVKSLEYRDPQYIAPEVLDAISVYSSQPTKEAKKPQTTKPHDDHEMDPHTPSSDMYSFIKVVLKAINMLPESPTDAEPHMLSTKWEAVVDAKTRKFASDLLPMLARDPGRRPTALQCLHRRRTEDGPSSNPAKERRSISAVVRVPAAVKNIVNKMEKGDSSKDGNNPDPFGKGKGRERRD